MGAFLGWRSMHQLALLPQLGGLALGSGSSLSRPAFGQPTTARDESEFAGQVLGWGTGKSKSASRRRGLRSPIFCTESPLICARNGFSQNRKPRLAERVEHRATHRNLSHRVHAVPRQVETLSPHAHLFQRVKMRASEHSAPPACSLIFFFFGGLFWAGVLCIS